MDRRYQNAIMAILDGIVTRIPGVNKDLAVGEDSDGNLYIGVSTMVQSRFDPSEDEEVICPLGLDIEKVVDLIEKEIGATDGIDTNEATL